LDNNAAKVPAGAWVLGLPQQLDQRGTLQGGMRVGGHVGHQEPGAPPRQAALEGLSVGLNGEASMQLDAHDDMVTTFRQGFDNLGTGLRQ
jgi:hypothetical protein